METKDFLLNIFLFKLKCYDLKNNRRLASIDKQCLHCIYGPQTNGMLSDCLINILIEARKTIKFYSNYAKKDRSR